MEKWVLDSRQTEDFLSCVYELLSVHLFKNYPVGSMNNDHLTHYNVLCEDTNANAIGLHSPLVQYNPLMSRS